MADKIVVLQGGRVEQVGSPLELYHHPANLFVAGFIGSPRMNLLPARLRGAEGFGLIVELPLGAAVTVPVQANGARPGDPVTLGLRPETLRPAPDGPLAGEVRIVERLGGLTLLHVALPDAKGQGEQMVVVQIEGSDATRPHQPIRLAVEPDSGHLFNEAGEAFPHATRHPLTH